jgi:hypothetical protein
MNNDIYNILFVFLALAIAVFVFVRISMKVRRHGGSMTTLMYGATDEFYNKENKKAIEYVVEQKAGKKTKDDLPGEEK